MSVSYQNTVVPPGIEPVNDEAFQPWALSVEEVIRRIETDATQGLSHAEARHRLDRYGRNEIPEAEPDPLWRRYWGQLTGDAVVRLLLVGGVISLLLGEWLEGIAILLMLNIMAAFGLWQEGQATDAARSLRRMDNPMKLVIRDGTRAEVSADEIVPGDVVFLPTGAIAPADGRLIASVNAEKDTSALTGESFSVALETGAVPATTVVNEQKNMIHRGNAVVSGNATYVVTSTGAQTEIGKIATTLSETEEGKTPLDEQLDQLGDSMASIFKWIAAIVIGFGLVRQLFDMTNGFTNTEQITIFTLIDIAREAFINAVALIIAAIPEGLPAVLTITLAIATRLMVRKNALIRKMKAVEGGGSMTVLLSDKTGTLTANQMTVTTAYLNGQIKEIDSLIRGTNGQDKSIDRALRIAKWCNNNTDPTEGALLRWVNQAGFEAVGDIIQTRSKEHEFDQSLKRMSTVHATDGHEEYHILTKGAPEQILQICHRIHLNGQDIPLEPQQAESVHKAIEEMAGRGLRVLALADRIVPKGDTLARMEAEQQLTLVGLLGIMDPPREDVAQAVATLDRAGIRTVMVTGDNPLTAYHIAKQVNIIKHDMPFDRAVITGEELSQLANPTPMFMERLHNVLVFARVTPQHKAEIVDAMQAAGFISGMTGDGVNDAIALKKSDVGFAMGNGTDVAREASDIVLMDSRFSTIPVAVEEGRNVLHRIRLYLSYILSGNGCEVGAFIVAYLLNVPIPLTALALLVINFATDSFPALAMAFEPGEQEVMQRPPRRRTDPFINRVMWIHIIVQSIVATAVIMGVYYYVLAVGGTGPENLALARGAAFLTYISQKLYRAFTARSLTHNVWEIGLFANRWSIGAVGISLSIALFFTYIPVVNGAMGMAGPGPTLFAITALLGLLPPVVEELTKMFLKRSTVQG